MTDHDSFDALFAGVDGPVSPDPRFATRLRTQLVARVAEEPIRTRPSLQVISATPTAPRPLRRHRWLDIAAAAVLLIGIISGMASLAPGGPASGPATIHAPETNPERVDRSPAGDNQYPGPAPSAAGYELLWSAERSSAVIHGTRLYRRFWTGPNQEFIGLEAQDLTSGEVIWQVPKIANRPFVATTAGIIVGLPEETGSPETEEASTNHMALLDLDTGKPVWIMDQMLEPSLSWTHVNDDALVFASEEGDVTALEIQTGQERWTYSYPRVLPPGVPEKVCYSGDCQERAFWPGSIVSKDGALYVSDSVTLQVYALNMSDGILRWSVDMIERTQSTAIAYGDLVAVDGGIVVSIDDIPSPPPGANQDRYYGMWSAESGDEVWVGDLQRAAPLSVSTGSTIYLEYIDPEQEPAACCRVAEIDVATGDPIWTSDLVEPASLIGYLVEAGVVLFISAEDPTRVIGRDDRTFERLWELRLQDYGCFFLELPLAADGTMACSTRRAEIRVFRPTGANATPDASPVVAEEAPTADDLAA